MDMTSERISLRNPAMEKMPGGAANGFFNLP